ncbi:N-acetyl-gamma-glutamyl-phosphate reductase [Arenimonas sp. GDDSR-1]|uniref:N-acetyl-gamma-glutamyl-phosphate reductase n=1 Tax=Arenimonas sp. GDDSR-1 TaxID=2950125 RepID=UPI0026051746|nr:N-acetyl-gamma-glutamyl-phosphate reductase [Arenimonas sp. GDDSR-1]
MNPANRIYRIGLIGARGHVGGELIRLLAGHPQLGIAFVSSREREGQAVTDFEPQAPDGLRYVNYGPGQAIEAGADAVILALPNGHAAQWAQAFDAAGSPSLLIDLSADFRFDPEWYYGLPELTRSGYAGQRRISNPGCYATAMQLAIAPMRDVLSGPVNCFGVSGYSGAGTTPSDKNNPEKLRDNLMPYALADHLHEREVSTRMATSVQFMPHVAPHFRGLSITANMILDQRFSADQVMARYVQRFGNEPCIRIGRDIPQTSAVAGTVLAHLGGFTLADEGRRLVVVSVLDNLLKGAASQALQNINLGLGLPETMGVL